MRRIAKETAGRVPVAVWAVLAMALLSYWIFAYKDRLQSEAYDRIQPLDECVREAGYRLAKGYLQVERLAAGDQSASGDEAMAILEQALTTVKTGSASLSRLDGRNDSYLHGKMYGLQAILGIIVDLAGRRTEAAADANVDLGRQHYRLYLDAEGIIAEIVGELKMRRQLIEQKQQQMSMVLLLAWVVFVLGMCAVILRAQWRSREWERALGRSEARLRGVLAAFPDPVLVVDRGGTILDVPSASSPLLPLPPDDMKGRPLTDFLPADKAEEGKRLIGEVLATGVMKTLAYEADVQAGHCYFEARVVPMGAGVTGQPRALWMVHDLTVFRQAQERKIDFERRLQQVQKLESLGVMAGGIAHDFDNLLTGVLGHTELAMGQVSPESAVYESLQEIHRAACRAAELAAQMLKYSGNSRPAFASVDLAEILRQVEGELRPVVASRIELLVSPPSQPTSFSGDFEQIRQLLRNLILNGVEAISGSGRVSVQAGIRHCDRHYLRDNYLKESHPDGDYAYLRVEDTGCGIDDEIHERLFDPFFTTKFMGRGLGLAAVHGIVRSHRGVIKLTSRVGEGACFEILFPVAPEPEDEGPDYSGIL